MEPNEGIGQKTANPCEKEDQQEQERANLIAAILAGIEPSDQSVTIPDHKMPEALRRVKPLDSLKALFSSAVPSPGHLIWLSCQGYLKARHAPETKCRFSHITGEITCQHWQEPSLDCRLPFCEFRQKMRARGMTRLRQQYAATRKKLVGRPY